MSAFDAAYRKGRDARLRGEPLSACPYEDKRKPSGLLSWSRAFQNAWRDGWEDADRDKRGEMAPHEER